jgi:cobyrinic acid a,c-diamide synthase
VIRIKSPRVVIAGLSGDSGKTLVSLGAIAALKARGLRVAPFKKGPDFIDAAWLGKAAEAPGRNLDTFLMPQATLLAAFARAAQDCDIAVVEGNRGLFDGMDAQGSHSTAALAKLIQAPVVLVIDVSKSSRTIAALVKGCQAMDPDLKLAAIILNRVGTERQEKVIRDAIASETGLPVIGAIPRIEGRHLPSRHLGLVPTAEHSDTEAVLKELGDIVERHAELSTLLEIARRAPLFEIDEEPMPPRSAEEPLVRIGVLQDRAFSFYYPENLEALKHAGAELIPISALDDAELPVIHGLYAGGGFPEVYAERLASNRALKQSMIKRIEQGLVVWAECGGLIYLSQTLLHNGHAYPMTGALPIVIEQMKTPQGHGYVQATVDRANPFFQEGAVLRGHEFHYSRVVQGMENVETVLHLSRGKGLAQARDGIVKGNLVAAYTHLHALGSPEWAISFIRAIKRLSHSQ